ncbi:retrovirus-related pol polyprotein from transposon TNT 1-94, partial [Tanacetum coccineum]
YHTTKQALGFQNPFYLKKAQRLEPKLYDANVIKNTSAIVFPDSEETLMLAEESHLKMLLKQQDPMMLEKKVNTTLDSVNSPEPTLSSRPTKVEVPKELPKVSMVNTSLKKLKYHLASFDMVVKERTTPTAIIEGSWEFELTKACFRDEIIPFEKVLEITALKDDLRKLKGKALVDNDVTKHTIDPKMLKIDVELITPKVLNKNTSHFAYIKHTQEEATVLRDLVEHVKSKYPLDYSLESACRSKTNKVEAHLRKVESHLKNKDYVVKPKGTAHIQHSKLNANSKLKCVKCNGCMLFDNHDLCVLDFINNVNARNNSKSVKQSSKRKVSKLTGMMFTNIGYIWRPSGRTFTIVGNACPLTRITITTEVPLRKPTGLENETPMAVITLVYSRKPRKSKTNVPVSLSWGSIVSDVPSSTLKKVDISRETSVARSPQQNGVVERQNCTLIKVAHIMLIYAKALLFLWAEAVATACYTQNCSIVRLRHGKTPYELLHDKPPDLSFFHVFGALCYPTNDSENLGKLQPKADIGIFIGYAPTKKAFRIYNRRTRRIIETIHVDFDELTAMASEHSSSGPALHEMTPATISSGLVPNPPPSTPFVPPSRSDWDLLFQPLFDELLTPPPSVDYPAPEVVAPIHEVVAPVPAVSTGSPSSTNVDQDAPSPSNSQTTPKTQPPIIPNDVEEDNHDIEVAHMDNDLYFGIPIPKVPSGQSSSSDSIHIIMHLDH